MTRSYGSKQISSRRARASLAMMLAGCTRERLESFTAAHLSATRNVTLQTAEEMLAKAKEARPA